MSSYRRPVAVWVNRATGWPAAFTSGGFSYEPPPLLGWNCRHCPTVYGWADTIDAACDAAVPHTKVCPWVVAGLNRLVAAVSAAPRLVPVPALEGRAFCRSCDKLVDEEHQHVEHHLVPMSERARLQAAAWADLGTRARDLTAAH